MPATKITWRDVLEMPEDGNRYEAIGGEFPETEEGVQPDLLFVSKERIGLITEDGIRGAPDLVIEILSPSTARRDRTVKRQLYQRQGVAEYWIVDLDAKQVEVWRFAAGAAEPERYTHTLPVRLGDRLIGEIELSRIVDWLT